MTPNKNSYEKNVWADGDRTWCLSWRDLYQQVIPRSCLPDRLCPWPPSWGWASRICSRRGSGATPSPSRGTWCIPDACRPPAAARSCGRPSAWPWSGTTDARPPERSEESAERSSASASSGLGRWSGRTTSCGWSVIRWSEKLFDFNLFFKETFFSSLNENQCFVFLQKKFRPTIFFLLLLFLFEKLFLSPGSVAKSFFLTKKRNFWRSESKIKRATN